MAGQSNSQGQNKLYGMDVGQQYKPPKSQEPDALAYGHEGIRGMLMRMGQPRPPGGHQLVQSIMRQASAGAKRRGGL